MYYQLFNKYGLMVSFGTVVLALFISLGIYNSQQYIIDPMDGSLKDTDEYGMLDNIVLKKSSLDKFDAMRYQENPDENAEIIGNVAPLVNLGYALFVIGFLAIIGTFAYNGVKDPRSIKSTLIFFGALFVLYFVCKWLSASEVPDGYMVETSSEQYQFSGGLLTMSYALGIGAVLSIATGGILAIVRK
jgi:hypothetical protein